MDNGSIFLGHAKDYGFRGMGFDLSNGCLHHNLHRYYCLQIFLKLNITE